MAERYIDSQLQVVRALETKVESLADAADESATRLVAGGHLYLSGEPGMVSELLSRAGGPCGARALPLDQPLPPLSWRDVVLLSDYGTPGKLAAALEKLGAIEALVIVFASAENPLMRLPSPENLRFVPVEIPLESYLLRPRSGDPLLPTASPAIATAQWTYVAELLGACRRLNRQLAIYLSIFLDEDRARFNRTKGLMFEPDLRPAPVARGQYARTFLGHVRLSLDAVRLREVANLRKAAGWLREAHSSQKQIVRSLMGHLPPKEAGLRGDVTVFTATMLLAGEAGEKWIRDNLRAGDVTLFLAYRDEDALTAAANAVGARTIALTSAPPGVEQSRSPRHLHINQYWPLADGCLELDGYDVKACPLSCIIGMTCYFAICGEMIAPASVSRWEMPLPAGVNTGATPPPNPQRGFRMEKTTADLL